MSKLVWESVGLARWGALEETNERSGSTSAKLKNPKNELCWGHVKLHIDVLWNEITIDFDRVSGVLTVSSAVAAAVGLVGWPFSLIASWQTLRQRSNKVEQTNIDLLDIYTDAASDQRPTTNKERKGPQSSAVICFSSYIHQNTHQFI